MVYLRDLQRLIEQECNRDGWPSEYGDARLGYHNALGKLIYEIRGRWAWGAARNTGDRFIRARVTRALQDMIRCVLIMRAMSANNIYSELLVLNQDASRWGKTNERTAMSSLADLDRMVIQPESLFGMTAVICKALKIKYNDVILSLTKEGM